MMILPAAGALPSGAGAERIARSSNYSDGQFHNAAPTEMMVPSASFFQLLFRFLFKPEGTRPPRAIPSVTTDLASIDDTLQPVVVWFGHSSYCIKYQGRTILVDPVFSGYASPFPFSARAFSGTDRYQLADFGTIDLLILTHDHYDHLDYQVMKKIGVETTKIVTSLGVGAHLEYWGIPAGKITELDWRESTAPFDALRLTAVTARHFSGRLFKRNQSLWSAFVLEWGSYKLFLGGDSGYGSHFKETGDRFGPFDLAILEAGQYNADWPFIHMFPEDAVQACIDLRAKAVLPVHWAKFALAFHPWNEPVKRILAAFKETGIPVAAPMIGEPVVLGNLRPPEPWWEF